MSEFTIVIRLESNKAKMLCPDHEKGQHPFINAGCYSGNGIAHKALDALNLGADSGDDNHPCPPWDGISCPPTALLAICAFKDAQQFRAWFPYIEGLQRVAHMARLALYRVHTDHINHGGHQITVRPVHMELVDVLLPTASIDELIQACTL